MPNYELDKQYVNITHDIMANEEFLKLRDMQHHHTTRLNHSLKVSYYSYKIAKALRLSYEEVARAGLLHDFYMEQVNDQEHVKDKVMLFTTKHPMNALDNASKYFDLTDLEIDIIKSHMFPVDVKVPKYAESWIVSAVDKVVSAREMGYKIENFAINVANVYLLFALKFIR